MALLIDQTPSNILERIISKVRRTLRDWRRAKIRKRFVKLPPSPLRTTAQSFSVHMLLCHKDLEMATCAAKSFILASQQAYCFTFHDDGSLTTKDKMLLQYHFPGCQVIDYQTSLQRAKETFGENSEIYKMRLKGVMMLKLIDIRLFSTHDKALLLDSDILFFERPEALLEAIVKDNQANVFNKDIETCYMIEQAILEDICGYTLPARINAGLSVLHTQAIRFDLLEKWLTEIQERKLSIIIHRIEQSLISMLCTSLPFTAAHLPEGYDVSFFKAVDTSVCKHYVGKIRHGFELEGASYLLKEKQFEKKWLAFSKS